jgi:hypothetical protein
VSDLPEDHRGAEEPSLDPSADARIRRLLADARHDEPIPVDVASRLEATLGERGAERQARRDEATAEVVDLAAARRRRTAASLLVAAAAVVVVGVGLGRLFTDGGAGGATASADRSAEQGAGGSSALSGDVPSAASGSAYPDLEAGTVKISSAHFGAGVRRVQARDSVDYQAGGPGAMKGSRSAPCPVENVGEGTVVGVSYDGAPAYLVFRPPAGGAEVVDLYLCGTTSPAQSITLPTP